MRRVAYSFGLLLYVPVWAQDPLSLKQAVELALKSNPLSAAADAGEKEAEAGVRQARAGYMPKLGFSESFQSGNNPVYVFGSLLTQHQFTADNFELGSLNRPDPLNNYQSRLSVEQILFDARQTSRGVQAARFTRQMAGEDTRRDHADILFNVVRTYFAVALATQNLNVAEQSLRSATADLDQAQAVYQSGRSTEAEVLALRVHVASVRQEQIRAANDLAVARATLNDALGVGLDRSFDLTTPLEPATGKMPASLGEYERLAAGERPEVRQADLAQRLAQTQQDLARSAYWPQVVFQGVLEADRQSFLNRGGGNWFTAVTLRWSLWNGGETKAHVERARFAEFRAEALRKRADSAINLEVRKAYLDLQAATHRLEVAATAVAEADEALRITQNRYQAGLTTITELLRSETALAAARTNRVAAVYEQRVAAAALEHAAGTLTPDSAVLN